MIDHTQRLEINAGQFRSELRGAYWVGVLIGSAVTATAVLLIWLAMMGCEMWSAAHH